MRLSVLLGLVLPIVSAASINPRTEDAAVVEPVVEDPSAGVDGVDGVEDVEGETASVAGAYWGRCRNPKVRREWRSLSIKDRKKYIEAIKCLMKKPPRTSKRDLPGAKSRYDDFLGTHIVQADDVHFVGVFYPYHRLYMHLFEEELQTCGWKGGIPYWDWLLDADDLLSSPIFDPNHGFGGNGGWVPGNFTHPHPGLPVNPPWDVPDRTGGGCIQTGPFKGLMSHLGPANNIQPNANCIRRDIAPQSFRDMTGPEAMAAGMSQPDHGFFGMNTEPTFHAGGHWGVGGLYGTMTDKWSSPADPLFYIHHANVDRAWWSWQMRDIRRRKADISGPLINFDYTNELGGNVTLNTDMFVGLSRDMRVNAKVRDVMHIQERMLCYTYDKLY